MLIAIGQSPLDEGVPGPLRAARPRRSRRQSANHVASHDADLGCRGQQALVVAEDLVQPVLPGREQVHRITGAVSK